MRDAAVKASSVVFVVDTGTAMAFKAAQLRTNSVVRWEYRPGSTLFLVWAHGRNGHFGHHGDSPGGHGRIPQPLATLLKQHVGVVAEPRAGIGVPGRDERAHVHQPQRGVAPLGFPCRPTHRVQRGAGTVDASCEMSFIPR